MRHLDLFSGIGGFALATEAVWGDVEHVFCDNDPFSQVILKKYWPNALIYGDIRELTAERITTDTEGRRARVREQEGASTGKPEVSPGNGNRVAIDILTGGFPCQPFSAAGRRRGTEDDRHLWPEMLRVIRETNPTYIVGENVGGFITWEGGLVFEQVCTDLEEAGYEVCPLVIPACAVNAPHRRDRVWIAAHRLSTGARSESGETSDQGRPTSENWTTSLRQEDGTAGASGTQSAVGNVTDRDRPGRSRLERTATRYNRPHRRDGDEERSSWETDWPQVAARLCTLDDGLPNGLARPRGWRNAALKGAGNAIVPQVATEIMQEIKHLTITQ